MTAAPPANGHANSDVKDQDVRPALLRQLREALTTGQHVRAREIKESLLLWDEFGGSDLYDRFRPSQADAGERGWVPLSVPSDRRHGAQWPVWRNQTELDELRQQSRLRLAGNSYARGLLRNLTNNVIGKGFAYTAVPVLPEGEQATGTQKALAKQVQAVIDLFLRLNNWNGGTHPSATGVIQATWEREVYRRVKGDDGECFLRFHRDDSDGTVIVRAIEPEQVRDLGGTPQEGWTYGIRHQTEPFEDVCTPLEYRVHWPDPAAPGGEASAKDPAYEDVDAAEVLHVKGPDTPSTVKRGLSGFLFDAGRALDRAARGQRNASLGAAYRAATAETWQHSTGTQAQVTQLAQGLGETLNDPLTGGPLHTDRLRAPAVRRIPESQELVPSPIDYSESYLAAFQGDLRQAAAAFCAPEFWMAETSSGNYSNLESAAAPAVRDGQCEQEYYKAAYAAAVWKAVLWARECGRLPAGVEDVIRIDVEAPAVLHRNELEKAQEDQVGVTVGWKDRQTCAEERGLDWDEVSRRNEEYAQAQAKQQLDQQQAMAAAGVGPGGKPPGGGDPGKPPPRPSPPSSTGGQVRESAAHDVSGEQRDAGGEWTAGAARRKPGEYNPKKPSHQVGDAVFDVADMLDLPDATPLIKAVRRAPFSGMEAGSAANSVDRFEKALAAGKREDASVELTRLGNVLARVKGGNAWVESAFAAMRELKESRQLREAGRRRTRAREHDSEHPDPRTAAPVPLSLCPAPPPAV